MFHTLSFVLDCSPEGFPTLLSFASSDAGISFSTLDLLHDGIAFGTLNGAPGASLWDGSGWGRFFFSPCLSLFFHVAKLGSSRLGCIPGTHFLFCGSTMLFSRDETVGLSHADSRD